MCGIAGIYNLRGKRKTDNKILVKRMAEKLAHRGPDGEGFFVSDNVCLGHRRLAILDLSEKGAQPMFSKDKNLVIVFNGEIYNYREIAQELKEKGFIFESGTDTEVILAAYKLWGKNCLDKFNGMWAFVIFDKQNNKLFAARDRLGVKPFYYFKDSNNFIFASEIKAILEYQGYKKAVNEKSVYAYLANGFTDFNNETFFLGIEQLLPGHYLETTNQEIVIDKYWDLKPTNQQDIATNIAVNEFQRLFEDSIKLRLRSDVTVGSCLSGGLDSSSIVMQVNKLLISDNPEIASQIGEYQQTFSSIYKSEEFAKANEKKYIDLVVEKSKVKPHFTESDPKKLWQELENLVYHQDEPFNSSSIYAQWNVFKLAGEQKIKVMLDGQGADEMMGGYLGSFGVYFFELFKSLKWGKLISEYRNFTNKHPESRAGVIRNFVFALTQSLCGIIIKPLANANKKKYLAFLNKEFVSRNYQNFDMPRAYGDFFKDFNYWQVKAVSLPSLLRYEDRNSMAHSIESRVPFLDYRLVEFIFSLKDSQLVNEGESKVILRKAMNDLLPKEIIERQDKVGFATPEEIWFKKYVKDEAMAILESDSFKNRPYFDYDNVISHAKAVLEGEKPFDFTLWRWINLEMWMREFIDK